MKYLKTIKNDFMSMTLWLSRNPFSNTYVQYICKTREPLCLSPITTRTFFIKLGRFSVRFEIDGEPECNEDINRAAKELKWK